MISTMKEMYYRHSLGRLCMLFGVTRQSHYQFNWHVSETAFEDKLVVDQAHRIRNSHPRIGIRKLYVLLEPFMLEHGIKMGRDSLFNLMAENCLLVRRRKRSIHTTNSSHWLRKYPNLIRDFVPTEPNQLWVSDITYWKTGAGILYLSLVTDAYSHKVVGYHVAQTLEAIESIHALRMAIDSLGKRPKELIHHSDRGVQYCSQGYIKLLKDNNLTISMTENGDPLENAIAERVNGILKGEYLECYQVEHIEEARLLVEKVVMLYNEERPHMSIGNKKPNEIHQTYLKTEKVWKNYFHNNRNIVNQIQD